MKLSGCDRVVMKNNMSGAKFLVSPIVSSPAIYIKTSKVLLQKKTIPICILFQNMSDKDLKRFPTAHIP